MSERSRLKAEIRRRRQARRNAQYITFGIIGLVIVGIIVLLVIQSKKNNATSPTAQPTPAQAQNTPAPAQTVPPAPTVNGLQFSTAPAMQIDPTKQYFATVKMVKGGEFVIQLYPDKAPITVNSFVFLANKGFFNGTTFHRVLEGFMAQGGDPTGTGTGGPGYEFVNEKNDLVFDKAGVVAMANAGANTNGSQFFITFQAVGLSENDYTIFGQVISGMDVVNGITLRDPDQNPTFTGDAIESITISEK
jgi:peptidylprolyl isomerase